MSDDKIKDAMRWAQEMIDREGTSSQSKVSMVSVTPLQSAETELILETIQTVPNELKLKSAERERVCYSRPAEDEIIENKDKN